MKTKSTKPAHVAMREVEEDLIDFEIVQLDPDRAEAPKL